MTQDDSIGMVRRDLHGTPLLPTIVMPPIYWLALVFGLALPTAFPGTANIVTLVFMGLGLVVLWRQNHTRSLLRQPAIALPLLAGLILLVALVPTATTPLHIVAVLILAPLWLAGPYSALLVWLRPGFDLVTIAALALLGAFIAATVTTYDVLALGAERGGWLVNNPIHLADLALMLGFTALIGLYDRRPIRWLFLLGPLFALVAVWFSGSRGPLLAFAAMLVVAGTVLGFTLLRRRIAIACLLVGTILIACAGVVVDRSSVGGRVGMLSGIGAMVTTGSASDSSTDERLMMYRTAWGAFQASPLYGHGIIDYTKIAAQYGPPDNPFKPSGHLHNDIADFAVIGGVLGLLAYLILLAAPIVGGFAVRGRFRQPAIYLGTLASAGYFAMGLTNAMLGILTQTVLYGVMLALIVLMSRGEPA